MNVEIRTFLDQGRSEGWSEETLKSYRNRLQDLARHLCRHRIKELSEVKPKHLDAYLRSVRRRGVKARCVGGYATTIRAFFRRLAEQGKLLSNPARELTVPSGNDEVLPVPPLEEGEVAELLDAIPRGNVCDLRNHAHLELLYGCGLRMAESLALNVTDVDLSSKTLHVRVGKGGKERLLPLGRGAIQALRDWLALRRSMLTGPDHGALFLGGRGQRLSDAAARQVFAEINRRRRGKRHVYPHLLRHSIAVHLLQRGADIRHVQEFLGHLSLDTTKIYLRLVPGRLKEDYDRAMPEIALKAQSPLPAQSQTLRSRPWQTRTVPIGPVVAASPS